MRGAIYPLLFLGFLLLGQPGVRAAPGNASATTGPECVILLHGLGRTSRSLNKMAEALQAAGLSPVNLDYPSREQTIETLALETIARGLDRCTKIQAHTVHFVTHSMGGVLVRYYLSRHRLENLGRVVMLSPPNRGSEAADHLKDSALYTWFNGPAGQQLVTGPEGLPGQRGPVDFPLGIITGNRHSFFDAWLAEVIPGADDGKVSVERAKVAGMADFLVLPHTHPFIMNAEEVIEQTLHFLHGGRFLARAPSADQSSD
jgi:pimeloyl-ACP methyl ester carboxylesterase